MPTIPTKEMLANQTPPLSSQAAIYAKAGTVFLSVNTVNELPSLNHINNLQSTLLLVMITLPAYLFGKAKPWKQLQIDETWWNQILLVNVIVCFLYDENAILKTVCLNGSIIAVDGTAESIVCYHQCIW